MSALADRPEVVSTSLSGLAEIANREHAQTLDALQSVLRHAISAGEALLEAQKIVGYGGWLDWLAENFHAHHRSANTYMLFATYRKEIENSNSETIRDARLMLRASGLTRHPSTVFGDEARKLRAGGMTYREIGERYGVTGTAVQEWCKTDYRKKRLAKSARRRREVEALRRQERDAAARKAGGGVSEVYSQIRKLAQNLDGLGRDGATVEIRAAANSALRQIHRAEDAIVKALGVSA